MVFLLNVGFRLGGGSIYIYIYTYYSRYIGMMAYSWGYIGILEKKMETTIV